MLIKFIENLRLKPKHIRDQYALGMALVCTLAIGGVWSLSLPTRFGGESQVAALASTTNAAPFSNFFSQLKHQFSGIKGGAETTPVTPPATTTGPVTAASSTAAALDLQLYPENKAPLNADETSPTSTKIHFGTSTGTNSAYDPYSKPVQVATSSSDSDSSVR